MASSPATQATYTHSSSARPVARWRNRVGAALLVLASLGAFVSFLSGIGDSAAANSATQVVEMWRMYGYLVFSGIYLLLAFWPHRYPGIWEIAILDKVALAITGLALLGRGVADAQTLLIADGGLAVITLIAYLLTRGYIGWRTLRTK